MAAQQQEGGDPLPWKDCLGQTESTEVDNALFFDYEYSIDQLMEIAGLCVAQVYQTSYKVGYHSCMY